MEASRSNVVAIPLDRDSLLDTRRAARHLGLSQSSLHKLRLSGDGPRFHDFGTEVGYHPEDLDEWADQRRAVSTSDLDPRPQRASPARNGRRREVTRQYSAGSSLRTCVVIVDVYEFRTRGEFFAFAYGPDMCACGSLRALLPVRLQISRQPFVDMARSLRAAGFDCGTAIIMAHDGGGPVALRSTIGDAAATRVTASRFGRPVFARHQAKVQHGSDRDAICRAGTPDAANENNAPAGPVLYLPAKRAA